MALADISVELGDDSGGSLNVATSNIAEKSIAYYWRQSLPYAGAGVAQVLQQNTGRQAKVLSLLVEARSTFESLNALVQDTGAWRTLVAEVSGGRPIVFRRLSEQDTRRLSSVTPGSWWRE